MKPDATLSPFLRLLGAELVRAQGGECEIGVTLDERHLNTWGSAHGGVAMTLLDAAMSLAGRTLHAGDAAGVTVEMSTRFLRPAGEAGMRVRAIGKAVHRSASLCFCEAELRCGTQTVARAMGTFKYARRLESAKRHGRTESGEDNTP